MSRLENFIYVQVLIYKLYEFVTGDPSLQQIVNDIQHTLYRLNPSVSNKDENDSILLKDQCGDTNLNHKLKKHHSEKVICLICK